MILITGNKGYVGYHLDKALSISYGFRHIAKLDASERLDWYDQWDAIKDLPFDTIVHCGSYAQAWGLSHDMPFLIHNTQTCLLYTSPSPRDS